MEKMGLFVVIVIFGVTAICYATFRFIHNEIYILKTTLRTSKGMEIRLCEEYINSLLNQIRTAANKISEVGVENLKLRSDLERDKIEIEGYKLRIEKLLEENKDLKDRLENKQITIIEDEINSSLAVREHGGNLIER